MVPLLLVLGFLTPKVVSAAPIALPCGTTGAPGCTLASNAPLLTVAGSGFSTVPSENAVGLSSGSPCVVQTSTTTQLTCQFTGTPSNGPLNGFVIVNNQFSSVVTLQRFKVRRPLRLELPLSTVPVL